MRANHWVKVVALASALGMTGAAIAQTTDRPTSTDSGITAATGESPAVGAIVMPQDRVMLNNDDDRTQNRTNDDTAVSNDDRSSVDPGPSRDAMSIDPGGPSDGSGIVPGRSESDRDASMRGE
jgi:hypothetical protein